MKQEFIPKTFGRKHLAIIQAADTILQSYVRQGYDISLRQLYYQFVSHHAYLLNDDPKKQNSEQSYKMLGGVIADARDAGLLDWNTLVDRGREVHDLGYWNDAAHILEWAANQYRNDLWKDQSWYVEVMIEKQALEGIAIPVCEQWQVPFSANRGYSSASALYRAGQRCKRAARNGRNIRIVYLGDHDPSGIDMTRDVRERLMLYAECGYYDGKEFIPNLGVHGVDFQFQVKRVALNMDQIEEYAPPPNPAKSTDSRYSGYRDQFGEESWELDALEPTVLASLIADAITDVIDNEAWDEQVRLRYEDVSFLKSNAEKYREDHS